MKLIVLAGLVAVEKAQLAAELANAWSGAGQRVLLLDNITRIAIDQEWVAAAHIERHTGSILPRLAAILAQANAGTVILAASETIAPDDLFSAIDGLPAALQIVTLALIDLRTCDCFPHLRALLEDYADLVVNLPYDTGALLAALDDKQQLK